ncbi:hypothetical protein C4552_01750 [Candidatus Parcubacteria bacterium]|nr:MAG: hypothetical protein C4552_01750 [Candidatus Parcubacteria bacterium]
MALYAARYEDRQIVESINTFVMKEAKRIADKLNEQIERGNDGAAFTIALMLGLLKDGVLDWILDFLLIGEIPVIGQIPGLLVSGIIMYFLWGKGWFLKSKIRVMYWILGLFFDNLPLFNNLPLTTLVILYAWHNVRKDMREAEEKREELETQVGRTLQEAA